MEKEAAQREVIRAARQSVYSNAFLLVFKLWIGLLMGSISVLSEAVHTSIDLAAAIVANFSVKKSREPADEVHTFGHGKFENISGSFEALLIFLASLIIIYESVNRILGGIVVEFLGAGIVVMGFSALINLYVSRRILRVARKHESLALEVDAYHLSTDVYTSLGVFAGLILIKLTGFTVLDPIIAIMVALVIMRTAYALTKRSMGGLMDVRLSEEEENIIKSIIADHYTHFAEFHSLRSRKSGRERFVDLHLVVPRDQHVSDAHDFCDHLEKDIREMIPNLNLLIHVEPCVEECEICQKICSKD